MATERGGSDCVQPPPTLAAAAAGGGRGGGSAAAAATSCRDKDNRQQEKQRCSRQFQDDDGEKRSAPRRQQRRRWRGGSGATDDRPASVTTVVRPITRMELPARILSGSPQAIHALRHQVPCQWALGGSCQVWALSGDIYLGSGCAAGDLGRVMDAM